MVKLKNLLFIFLTLFLVTSCVQKTNTVEAKPPVVVMEATPPLAAQEPPPKLSLGEIPPNVPTIKVALLVPLSAESAPIGNAMFDAATMALYDAYVATPSEQIKAQIILIPKDTGLTAIDSLKSTKQAVEQGASVVIGPLFSQSVTAVKPYLKEKNIPMISFSNNKAVAAPGAYTFGILPEQQLERVADYAFLGKIQRVALLAPNDAYGEKVRDTLADLYVKKGGTLTSSELFAPSQTNIDAAVARLAAAYNNTSEDKRYQAIFIADGGAQVKNIIKSLHKNNINLNKVKLLVAGLWDDPEIAKIIELQGAIFPGSPQESYNNFEKRFMTTYGYKPVRLASLAYDAVTIAARVAMEGNGINNATLTDPKGFNTPAGGLVRLTPEGTSDRKLTIMQIDDGEFKVKDRALKSFSE